MNGLDLLSMMLPLISELDYVEATNDEIITNLETHRPVDLLDVYNHRTECENCNRDDYEKECPFILQTYGIIRTFNHGLQVHTEPASSCRAKADPYRAARVAELFKDLRLPKEFTDKTVKEYEPGNNDSQASAKKLSVGYVNGFIDMAERGRASS